MTVFIAVACVNLITLTNAFHDINYDTILKIIKDKPTNKDYSKAEDPYERVELLPITSKYKSKSLIGNPKAWPEDQFEILNTEDKRYDQTVEPNQNTVDVLINILKNTIQNSNKDRLNKNYQKAVLMILLKSRDDGPRGDMTEGHVNFNTRRKLLSSDSDSTESDSSDSYEKNPGNPYTIHKNKYKQNWPYNHFMDGDHMNINPFGPQFANLGPTGPELFFGRKWWYFNQDDYKPIS